MTTTSTPSLSRPIGLARIVLTLAVALAFPVAGAEASTQTQAFTVTGEHAFVVPAAVTSLQVTLAGGTGAPGVSTGATPAVGGFGAAVSASLAVTPGQTIYAEVAGNGRIATPSDNGAGYGGGGGGGPVAVLLAGGPGGGGGGGASDVRACPLAANPATCSTLGSRFVVAAGGGGGGGAGLDKLPVITGGVGGAAGLAGASGAQDSLSDLGGGGGGPANQAGGGSAGINSYETQRPPDNSPGAATEATRSPVVAVVAAAVCSAVAVAAAGTRPPTSTPRSSPAAAEAAAEAARPAFRRERQV